MDGIDHVKYLRPGTTLMAVAAHNNFQFSNKIYLPNTTANFFISLGYLDRSKFLKTTAISREINFCSKNVNSKEKYLLFRKSGDRVLRKLLFHSRSVWK